MESTRPRTKVPDEGSPRKKADNNLAGIRQDQHRTTVSGSTKGYRYPALGAVIRDLRFAHGWQAKRLAIDADISPELLSGLEKHGKMVSLYTLQSIATCFKVPLSALFFMAENYTKEDVLNYPEQHFFRNTMELCYLLRSLQHQRKK